MENKIILYQVNDTNIKIDVYFKDETFWLSQKNIAELFGVNTQAITKHLQNIYEEQELSKLATCSKMEQVRNEGTRKVFRTIEMYNLDAIIAVGYRVNSKQATQFRIWATNTLREYIVKGFVLNDDMLKNGQAFGKDYFVELLERVRSIRASERRIYQQITDIFAECSTDYDPNSQTTRDFYSMVQNKFHYAITNQTAAEIVITHADSQKPNMGITTWKNSPGRILKSDVTIAKNYLSIDNIKKLERASSSFFDYIERIIEDEKTFTMIEFAQSVDAFLTFNRYQILEGKGSVSMQSAKAKAHKEYNIFNKTQKITSDFDKLIKRIDK